jgi:O-antigen/teichoic acid export membrane protein
MYINIQAFNILSARNEQWRWAFVMGASCVINPIFNVAFIPIASHLWHNAALGAALALLGTELLMSLYAVVTLRRIFFHPVLGRAAVAAVFAVGGQVQILWMAQGRWLVVAEVLAGLIYLALLVWLDALPQRDLVFLWNVSAGRLQRRFQRVGA